MTQQKSIKAWISGRVQGVYSRQSTRMEADRLNISGYAKNLADGRVEVIAQGDADDLDEFLLWLKKGPETARVEKVEVRLEEAQTNDPQKSPVGFRTF